MLSLNTGIRSSHPGSNSRGSKMAVTTKSIKKEEASEKQTLTRKKTRSMGNIQSRPQSDQNASPPRPPNAWILYRSNKVKEFKARKDSTTMNNSQEEFPSGLANRVGPQAVVSKIISDMWKAEKKEVKMNFVNMAAERKKTHLEMFPNYKYRPKRNHVTATKPQPSLYPALPVVEKVLPRAKLAKAKSFCVNVKRGRNLPDSRACTVAPQSSHHPYSYNYSGLVASPCADEFNRLQESEIYVMQQQSLQSDWSCTVAATNQTCLEREDELCSYFPSESASSESSGHHFSLATFQSNLAWQSEFHQPEGLHTALQDQMAQQHTFVSPHIPIWNTTSSASSWQSDRAPIHYGEMFNGGSHGDPYPQSPCIDYFSATTSPFHPYSNGAAGEATISLSPLYLGTSSNYQTESRPPLYSSSLTDASTFPSTSPSFQGDMEVLQDQEDNEKEAVNLHGSKGYIDRLSLSRETSFDAKSQHRSELSHSTSMNELKVDQHTSNSSTTPFPSPTLSLSWQASTSESALPTFKSQSDLMSPNLFADICIHSEGNSGQIHDLSFQQTLVPHGQQWQEDDYANQKLIEKLSNHQRRGEYGILPD